MSNQPNTNKEELLKSIKTALRGSSLLFYGALFSWGVIIVLVFLALLLIGNAMGAVLGGFVSLFGFFAYLVFDVFAIVYGAHLLRRGIKGIGGHYNNHDLISKATSQFIWWIVTLVIPIIGLIFLGLRMRVISKTLHDLTGIEDFDTAADRWKLAAYLAIILIGGLIALFALYSTRKGFRGMVNQMVQ
jgi:uncharacterized membrane protein